jgi:hypothetical protein
VPPTAAYRRARGRFGLQKLAHSRHRHDEVVVSIYPKDANGFLQSDRAFGRPENLGGLGCFVKDAAL